MGYKDDANTVVAQLAAGSHQLLHFLLAEGRGGLVHDNHFRINQNCLCNFDHLLHTHTERTCGLGWINILTEGSHDFLCLLMHGFIIKQTARSLDPFIDEDIVCDTQLLFHVQLLVYTGNTGCGRFIRILECQLLSIDVNLALIRLMYTGQHLNQCGLACTILADQAQNLARPDCQLHFVQCNNTRKDLGTVAQLYNIFTTH